MVSSLPFPRKIALTGLVWLAAAEMLVGPADVCQALTVKSDVEGNIFTDMQKMTFQISDFTGTVRYELRDYFDTIITSGKTRKQKNITFIAIPSPGPGHYMLTCHDNVDTVRVAAGVVIDRGDAPLPHDGRICGQSSAQWLLKDEAGYNRLARIIKRSGIPWVRDAIYWGVVESTKGQYTWGETIKAVRAMNANGIRVSIWLAGDSPMWARTSGSKSQCPEDYRELYRFSRILAEEFKDSDIAWEIGIEPDMNGLYWFDLGDLVAGFHKAAYLGIKDGDPDQTNLSTADQQTQCRFVAQSITMALAAGADKAFYFLIPGIHEPKGNEFGLLYADLSPYPGYIALSAAANIIGLSSYAWRYEYPADTNVEAHAFTISGVSGATTIVAWSSEPGELRAPTEKKSVQVADIFGKNMKSTLRMESSVSLSDRMRSIFSMSGTW